MRPGLPIRLILAAVVTIAVTAVIVAILMATDTMLSIWQRLDRLAPWASGVYLLVLGLAGVATAWFVWRLLAGPKVVEGQELIERESLENRIEALESDGVNVSAAKAELIELDRRQSIGRLYLALFGEISAGKSSLINALLPAAQQQVGVVGGTTTEIRRLSWQPSPYTIVEIVDLPGYSQVDDSELAEIAQREALRAHLVIYVCDGDLNRRQHAQISTLAELEKPIVVALNKADQFDELELTQIQNRLLDQIDSKALEIVPIQTGGLERVKVIDAQGATKMENRPRPPDVTALSEAIIRIVTGKSADLSEKHEIGALAIAAAKLRDAEDNYREQAAETLIHKYSRRAVIGALAAITPGSDLVIQGALATRFLHELCTLYGVPIKSVDLDRFLTLAGGKIRRTTSLALAVAGNGLKAFPGIGTIAGGIVHAVAYGMIFDSLGRSVAGALAKQRAFTPSQLADQFEEQLIGNMETRAGHFVRLALAQLRSKEK